MAKQLQLSIPTPCHENWDAMRPDEKGRFCGSCQKQVVDFSNMSDRQVAEFFKKPSTGSVCGRFMSDQLERDIEIPKKRIPWLKYFFQFVIPAFLVSIKATSQRTQGKLKATTLTTDTARKPICDYPTMGIVARPIDDMSDERGIAGKVVDAISGKPLPVASIEMFSTIGQEHIFVTEKGFFKLDIYRKITVDRIEISCPGYIKRVLTLQEFMKTSRENRPINMEKEKQLTLGQAVVGTPVCIKPLMGDTTIVTPVKYPFETVKGEISKIAIEESSRTIRGTVTNEKGDPLPGVSIVIKGTRTTVSTDNNGQFRILAKTGNILVVTAVGTETTEAVVGNGNSISISVKSLFISGYDVGLIVLRVKPRKEIKNVPLMKEAMVDPSADLFKVFPNPVSSGSNLNIELKQTEEGYYSIQLLDESGQSVLKQEMRIGAEEKLLNITIPPVAAGSYFLVLVDKRSGKRFTEKIIIQ